MKMSYSKQADYALSRWRALSRYIDDGRVEMDDSATFEGADAMCAVQSDFSDCSTSSYRL